MLAAFTYVFVVLLALLVAGSIAGLSAWGWRPLRNFDGTLLSAPHTLALTFAAVGRFAVPLIGVAAFALMLSTITHNGVASIIGTFVYALAQEAIGGLVHQTWAKLYLLSDQFDGWHGVFMSPTDWTVIARAFWVSAIFTAVPLAIAFVYFRRRDVAGE
jgi:ABC-2 type transport system permease protein